MAHPENEETTVGIPGILQVLSMVHKKFLPNLSSPIQSMWKRTLEMGKGAYTSV